MNIKPIAESLTPGTYIWVRLRGDVSSSSSPLKFRSYDETESILICDAVEGEVVFFIDGAAVEFIATSG